MPLSSGPDFGPTAIKCVPSGNVLMSDAVLFASDRRFKPSVALTHTSTETSVGVIVGGGSVGAAVGCAVGVDVGSGVEVAVGAVVGALVGGDAVSVGAGVGSLD
jgi:uncharacterized protein YcfJ